MASPPACQRSVRKRSVRKRLAWLIFPALFPATLALAGDDGEQRAQQPRLLAIDVETTAALPPYPDSQLRFEVGTGLDAVKAAVAAYRRGALSEGDAIATTIDDRTAKALLEWVAIRAGTNAIPFSRLSAFLQAYPNYPATTQFRRRAEEALIAEKKDAATIRAFFYAQRPVGPAGRVALALALKAQGQSDDAAVLIRQLWRQDHLGQPLEAVVLAEFGDILTRDDHRLRTERYLFRENAMAAMRNAARVSADYVVLARVRLASAKERRPLPASLIASVPASLKGGISFAFLQAQQARRTDKPVEAAKALSHVPRDPNLLGDGDEWWTERRLIARKLLDAGDAAKAYEVVAGHGAEEHGRAHRRRMACRLHRPALPQRRRDRAEAFRRGRQAGGDADFGVARRLLAKAAPPRRWARRMYRARL
jgi:soluble lytic murein transglycosylase